MVSALSCALVVALQINAAPAVGNTKDAVAKDVITKDVIAVTAKLVDIGGKPPPNDLYDYGWVMKYVVVGGEKDGTTLYVTHFNPRKRRDKIRDDMKKFVAGKLRRFKVGDVHEMQLTPHIDAIWKNAIEDPFEADRKVQRYWCLGVHLAD